MSDGVDVSNWQGRIDWDEARRQLGFAMCKATQATSIVDVDYARNIAELRELDVRRGSYHYPDPGDPIAQAEFYIARAERRDGEMQALDFEGPILETGDPVEWARAWLAHVSERTGNVPLIYMSGSTCTRFDWRPVIELGAGLWVASWGVPPAREHLGAWPFAIMWQRSDTGELRGADGDVDTDVFYGDADVWARYADNRPAHDPEPDPEPRRPRPTPEPPADTDGGSEVAIVQPGNTLARLAHEHQTTVEDLVRLNEDRYPSLGWNRDLIQVGWRLRLR